MSVELGMRLALGFTLVASVACMGQKALAPLPPGGTHVLFIGNSLTYVNDLPGTVEAVAALGGDLVRFGEQSGPNLALIDHFNGATGARAAINVQKWDFVVLQQGPTPPGICRDSLVLWTKMFDPLIKAQGAKTSVFQTWPLAGPISWFDNISPSFVLAASSVNGVLMPVGDAWRRALIEDSTLPLYSGDGLHPAPVGTFLAALVIYERVTGNDARNLPAKAISSAREFEFPEAKIRLLQRVAHEAVVAAQASTFLKAPAPPNNPVAQATSC
jgi:hypothetical protein